MLSNEMEEGQLNIMYFKNQFNIVHKVWNQARTSA